ncbi:histidine kinase [Halorientalis brevis]|uniref:Histidine kinase n=1 Tax=Halorientalis brevis TaxID=1126241 RepID=A0ABD6CDL2_9EURY|nr:histidine kinase [Halorientalis brevis]
MSIQTDAVYERGVHLAAWQAGVVGGLVGAGVMAVLMVLMNPPVLTAAIPALYGVSGGIAGVTIHLAHGAVLGVAFAAVVQSGAVGDRTVGRLLGAGIVWGVLVWATMAALVMPVWLASVGFPMAPPFPNFAVPSLLWHVVYGGALGAVYVVVR